MSKDGRIWLSHTGIENLNRCPRCFFLQYKKNIRHPEGIVSRLANRFDSVLKTYFDQYRTSGKLPELVLGKLEGQLQNPFQEKYYARINDNYGFWGKLDECLVNEKGEFIPVDFKTASSDPREKEVLSAYQAQIDDYIFLLNKDGKKTAGFGYLIFVFPDIGNNLHNGFPMIIHIVKLEGNPDKTTERINNAITVLESSSIPEPLPTCPFCSWLDRINLEIKNPFLMETISVKSRHRNKKKTDNNIQTSII